MNAVVSRRKVLVLGGGFAGVETATYLAHAAPDKADITVVSQEEEFLFRPNTIYIPFGLDPKKLRFPLGPALGKKGIAFEPGVVRDVDLDRKVVGIEKGQGGTAELGYDYLVLAMGARMRPTEVPGLEQYAHTPWTPAEMARLGEGFQSLVDRGKAGERTKALFLIPPQNKCSGPLYELVFMFDTWLRRQKARDWITLSYTTFESTFIQAFGPKVHGVVAEEFKRRGIDGHNEWVVDHVEDGRVLYKNGEEKPFDLLASFPPYVGNPPSGDFPVDDRGFLLTEDLGSRRLKGHPEVFVPGDNGDFPVKQAFLAFLQGDATASHLAAELTGGQPDYAYDPISMCVMEQMDKAVFAQVPLQLTGDPARPVKIREGADKIYKIGAGRTWRLGKLALGYYLPFRFKAGEPFHAGRPWEAMELSLKAMAKVMAH